MHPIRNALRLTGAFVFIALLLLAARPAALAQTTERVAEAARAVTWLVTTHQNEDGGYTSFSSGANEAGSDIGGTLDALIAIAATGRTPAATVNYLEENAQALVAYAETGGGEAGKALIALDAIERDPRAFAGTDFVVLLTEQISDTGEIAPTPFNQALAILGLEAADEPVPPEAADFLAGLQAEDGSWDDGFGTTGNTDATAMAVMALRDTDAAAAAEAGIDYLLDAQLQDGGWEYGGGFGASANSTALAIQALQGVAGAEDAVEAGLDALLALRGETGAFQSDVGDGPEDDFFATVQALPALAGRTLPLSAPVAQQASETTPTAEATADTEATEAPEPTLEPTTVPEDEAEAPEIDEPVAAETGELRFWLALAGFVVIGAAVIFVGWRMGRGA